MRRRDARGRVPIAAVKGLVGAALRHYNANNKAGAGFIPLEPSMAACRACCCGPKGFTRLVGFWARRRRSGTPPPGTSSSAAGRCRRRRNTAPPPGATPDCCCFYAELHFDRLGSLVVDTCIIVGKPPSRQEQLTDKQPRPNKKKKQWREMEEIREFCPSYEEALQLNPTDEAVSEEELRHSHCC
ncbi:uncharacterized protein [Oryza sativa Japonica Group]|uniref:Os01g0170750 protein n=1 Tax=Oryza sativa subsp. japonica TaxID=39947 RepID=A0A0P0UYT0_ORYSJ|nr:Os01g0170750 [Oryza sativa Japonica Group]